MQGSCFICSNIQNLRKPRLKIRITTFKTSLVLTPRYVQLLLSGQKFIIHTQTQFHVNSLKGCDSNFEVKCSNFKLLQMKQLPCIKQYVLG